MGLNASGRKRAGHHLAGLVVGFQLLVLFLALSATSLFAAQQSVLPDHQHPVLSGLPESQPPPRAPIAQPSAGIGEFLDDQGRLALPEGFSGSLDPAGFEMLLGEDGAPRFLAQGGPADPDDRWDDQFFLGSGCNFWVFAIALGSDGTIYLGGDFQACGGVAASNVVRFDPATGIWSALGSGSVQGVNDRVWALAVSGNDLFVGGNFVTAGGISANRIARFNTLTNTWSAVGNAGNGVSWTVRALAVHGSDLFVGGEFTQADVGASGITANRIARFDTIAGTWHALGSGGNGLSSAVLALAVAGNDLYVGGLFSEANVGAAAITANRIARFDTAGGTWHALGSGGNGVNASVFAMAVSGSDLYVGGGFLEANVGASAITANRVARFDTVVGTW